VSALVNAEVRNADLGSSAGQDTSAIGFAGLSEFAEPLLQLVNELAREAAFPESEFERERRQKLEEVKLERTSPGFLGGERLRKILFGAHPYARVSPSEAQVAAYKRDDLQNVYREIYTPENALLMLVGDFDPDKVAHYGKRKVEQLLGNPGIIRNRLKIDSAIQNAKAFLEVQRQFGSFDRYIWQFVGGKPKQNTRKSMGQIPPRTRESDKLSEDLKSRGFKFVGSTICYAHMQAVGMVNDHVVGCFRYKSLSGGR